jgi:hypothetical protein
MPVFVFFRFDVMATALPCFFKESPMISRQGWKLSVRFRLSGGHTVGSFVDLCELRAFEIVSLFSIHV